jgi:hypothetical protein
MLSSFFKKKTISKKIIEPTVFDFYGAIPKDSFFYKIAVVVDREMINSSSTMTIDWAKNFPIKPNRPEYARLFSFYAYILSLELFNLNNFYSKDLYSVYFKDELMVERLACIYAFNSFGGLYVGNSSLNLKLNDLNYVDDLKLDLLSSIILNKAELVTTGAEVSNKGNKYFSALANDESEGTKNYLDDIGKYFIASIVARYDCDEEKISNLNEYGKKLFNGLEINLLNSSL